VVHIEEHYLYEPDGTPPVTPQRGDPQMSALTRELHDYFREPQRLAQRGGEVLEQVSNELHGRMDRARSSCTPKSSWNYITEQYRERCTDPSFVDYFWTVRTMHTPDLDAGCHRRELSAGALLPLGVHRLRGLSGALLKRRWGNRHLILSEHGIYTKERRIDLYAARWIADNRTPAAARRHAGGLLPHHVDPLL
jgi:hypothetical protein